jgi:hypothetical protein
MASRLVDSATGVRTGALLVACVAEHGSATHPYFASPALVSGPEAARNLADAVHFLCALHGRHPGVLDHAATRNAGPRARIWLAAAAEAMAEERLHLTRRAVAAGPKPSTPGGSGSETAILSQRGALATLALSDRRGCALGAALAFAADWHAIREILDAADRRVGVDPRPRRPGEIETLTEVAEEACENERALLFGAQQMSLQHRALWDLLEARQQARRGV